MPNGLVFKYHLNTGQMDAILFSCVLVRYSNGWSSAFVIRTLKARFWNGPQACDSLVFNDLGLDN